MKKHNKLDKGNLRQVIIDSPKQFSEGFKLAENIKLKRQKFNSVCISGMGGSSLPADLLRTYIDALLEKHPATNKGIEVIQNKSYALPARSLKNCLHIFSSFSGNTEETLASLEEAIKLKLPSIGVTNGGKLQALCEKYKVPCVIVPPVIQPRYATGYLFSVFLQLLINSGLVEDNSEEIIKDTKALEKNVIALENKGKSFAKKLAGKTPVIHTTEKLKAIALIWKIKVNENAKTPCFWNFYPELNHNEMVGYTLPQGKFHAITLLDPTENSQIIKRMKITAKLLKTKGIDTTFFEMPESSLFSKMFTTLLLGDWTSYYLALEYKQDPTPVDMVEDLKKALA